jgi:outer membrane receptor protein involved in Fe transport
MGWRFLRGGVAVAAAMTVSGVARAQAISEDGDLVVTATREAMPMRVPDSVSIIRADQIAQTPAKTLDDVLRTVASINLPAASSTVINPAQNIVSMRGLGGSRALVLLDGVPLNDPFFGYVQWNMVPLESVRQVEVVRGGGSALWGNYAMGGVINILTRLPDKDALGLSAGYGSYGTVRADLYGAIGVIDGLRVGVEGTVNSTDGYIANRPVDLVPLTVPTRSRADNVSGSASFDLSPTLSGTVRIGYHDIAQTQRTPRNQNSQQLWNYSGSLTQRIDDLALSLTAFRTVSHYQIANVDTPTGATPGTVEYVQNYHETPATATGGALVATLSDRGWLSHASVGADYQLVSGVDTGLIYSPAGALLRTDTGSGKQRFYGLFAQAALAPVPQLEILANARYQHYDNLDGFDGSPAHLGNVPDTSASSFDPRLSVRYAPIPQLAFRAAASRAFRAPTLNNLYRSFSTRTGIFLSNAALRPETLSGWEAGADLTLAGLSVHATYYDNVVKDLLTTQTLPASQRPAGFVFGTRNINAGSARARGFELEANWTILPRLVSSVSYTLADSVLTANAIDPTTIGKQLGGVPRQAASGRLDYTGSGGWKLSSRLRWQERYFSDNAHTLPVDSQLVVDLEGSVQVRKGDTLFVGIENLFDRRSIVDNSGTTIPQLSTPFTAFGGVRVRFH